MTTELEALKKRVEELENALKPPEPFVPGPRFQFDPTDGMSMPKSAMKAMIEAIPASVMREIAGDARRPNPVTEASSSPLTTTPAPQAQPVQRGSGWRDAVPLTTPPGIDHVDRLVDTQDRIDKAELALKLAKTELGKAE
jgi:hypothetical protein